MTDLPPREVDRLETAIRELTGALDRHRVEMASTYVRKDVYVVDQTALKTIVSSHSKWFNLIATLVVVAIVGALLSLVVVSGGAR